MQTKEQKRVWREKNRDKINKQQKAWRDANPEKVKKSKKRDYEINKDRYKKYAEDNKESRKAKRKIYESNQVVRMGQYERNKRYREKYPEKAKMWRDKSRKTNRAGHHLSSIKKNCKAKGIQFNLTKEWIQERYDKGVCELTGIPFDMEETRSANSPSVDRIIPGGSYTKDNCRMILWSLNRAFNNYGQDYLFFLFETILRREKPEIFKVPEMTP